MGKYEETVLNSFPTTTRNCQQILEIFRCQGRFRLIILLTHLAIPEVRFE